MVAERDDFGGVGWPLHFHAADSRDGTVVACA